MNYRAVRMYGVAEDQFATGGKAFHDICEDNDGLRDYRVVVDDFIVPVHIDITEDMDYVGFDAGYPWNYRDLDLQNLQDYHIKKAIATFLELYDYSYREVYNAVGYISDADKL